MIKPKTDNLLLAVDLAGTFLFAIEGALSAIKGNLDFLGLMVLAFATALGGGIIRDVLIGAIPPNSIREWRYGAVAFSGGAVVFFLYRFVEGIPSTIIMVLDAAGLALFAVSGARKALEPRFTRWPRWRDQLFSSFASGIRCHLPGLRCLEVSSAFCCGFSA